jgi:hypothetical protein
MGKAMSRASKIGRMNSGAAVSIFAAVFVVILLSAVASSVETTTTDGTMLFISFLG